MAGDREGTWLPLLRRLSAAEPTWLVWKNVESALHGTGDVDSAAAPEAWPALTRLFAEWAWQLGSPAVVCPHVPGGLNLVATPPGEATVLELSVKDTKAWRGGALFTSSDLLALATHDPRGFRHLRPGAEGVLKLLLNGVTWAGTADRDELAAKKVPELLAADDAGIAAAAQLLGLPRRSLLSLAEAAAAGRWDRSAALRLEAAALARAGAHPATLTRRARFRLRTRRSCPVLDTLLTRRRRAPDDLTGWLRDVRRHHTVLAPPGGPR